VDTRERVEILSAVEFMTENQKISQPRRVLACALLRACIAGLVYVLLARSYATPQGASGVIEVRGAREDFRIMQAIFSQAHATAFMQIPNSAAPDLFADTKKSRTNTVSVREFISRVLQYYRGIRVDHTGLGFSPELMETLGLKTALFPFPLKFLQGRAYFDCEYNEIRYGAELLQINGQSLPEIIQRINTVTIVLNENGQSDDYRLTESFPYLYYLLEGPRMQWQLALKTGDSVKEVLVDTSDASWPRVIVRKSLDRSIYKEQITAMFNAELHAAYLAINSFMPSRKILDSVESWDDTLYNFHRDAAERKVENLVIDLRINRGGVMLFSAAAARWFIETRVEDKSRSRARSRVLPYREYVHAINSMAATEQIVRETEQHLQTGFADKMTEGYFETRRSNARYMTLAPLERAHRFRRIYILISRTTYSAAVNFARLVKLGNPRAVLVGEETGSPGDGHSAEILITYKLPHSGLLFEIPLVQVLFNPLVPKQQKGRGLMPDIVSAETPADFVSGRDTQLEAVSAMMQKLDAR
jgi:hypothetical protein